MLDRVIYVGVPEEKPNWQPSPLIPVRGSAIDQYRTFDIAQSNLNEIGTALVDIEAANALGKILSGGIESYQDIEAAELALQAVLLHDFVPVFHAAPKIFNQDDFLAYAKPRDANLSSAALAIFELVGGVEWIICPEYAVVRDGVISGSKLVGSAINGAPHAGGTNARLDISLDEYLSPAVCESVHVCLDMHAVPAYIANRKFSDPRLGDDFSKTFYQRMRKSWSSATKDQPAIHCTFSLPPLLAIALDRLNNRQDLKAILTDLRSELKPVRGELREFNDLLHKSITQAELERRMARITSSFDAIVPYSRMSKEERRLRSFAIVQRLLSPLIKAAVSLVTSTGASYGDMVKAAASYGMKFSPDETISLVNRTVTARTFAGLLEETESLQALIKHHLSSAELRAVEKSLRERDKQN
ncbi:MAG: hypothetical protein ACTHJR_19540 [Sphingomonas sp.]|uniref:hypothetical protein n=1 Tax=Sphingomonas sp. TaxID=28214 RepID=UPI003F8189AB